MSDGVRSTRATGFGTESDLSVTRSAAMPARGIVASIRSVRQARLNGMPDRWVESRLRRQILSVTDGTDDNTSFTEGELTQIAGQIQSVKDDLRAQGALSAYQCAQITATLDEVVEASRLADLGATITVVMYEEGLEHYAVGMKDPEGNEFDIN